MLQKQDMENLAYTELIRRGRYMQDVLNGMSPSDAWALHGSPLFNRVMSVNFLPQMLKAVKI